MEPLATFGLAYLAYLAADLFNWSGILSLIGTWPHRKLEITAEYVTYQFLMEERWLVDGGEVAQW